jgi:N-acyl-D-aspartate/D-glutamate deacylase
MASPVHPEWVGGRLSDIAQARGVSPLDVMLDASIDDELATVLLGVVSNDDPDEVTALLQEEHCTLGLSDAGAHLTALLDAVQATDFLGSWVRDRAVVPIEHGVRMLTGAQADLFGMADRGYLRPGAWADIVVFDPATVGPGPVRRVRDFPADAERLTADQPTGITHVLVNGTPIRLDGTQVIDGLTRRPGQVLGIGAGAKVG